MPVIILEQPYTMKHGITKPAGTELTFAKGAPEAEFILDHGIGYEKAALPKDLPARRRLLAAGYDSLQSLRAIADDFTVVNGIGPKTAEELNDYFTIKTDEE